MRSALGSRWELLAGFACGWALSSEYTAGIVVLAIIIWFILENRRPIRGPVNTPQPSDSASFPCHHSFANRLRWLRLLSSLRTSTFGLRTFFLASLPPLLLIPLYNWLCFGNPFILPYSLNESFPAMREGLYAIKWPDPETAYNLLFSPTRGLFFWTPFLVMALPAIGTSSAPTREMEQTSQTTEHTERHQLPPTPAWNTNALSVPASPGPRVPASLRQAIPFPCFPGIPWLGSSGSLTPCRSSRC